MVVHEWRLQWRTLRFRLGLVLYLLLAVAPALVAILVAQPRLPQVLGGNSYLSQVLLTQPLAAALLSILVSGNGSSRAALNALWVPLASARRSSIGYLSLRWLAQQSLLWPLMFLPLGLIVGLTVTIGSPPQDVTTWLGHWALVVLPVPVVVGALWLGVTVLAGSELVAAMVSFIGVTLFGELLGLLFRPWRMRVNGVLDGIRMDDFNNWVAWLIFWLRRPQSASPPGLAATQAGSDLTLAWHWVVTRHGLAWGLSILCLALAAAFVGRTRRDLQPLRIDEDHALRSYLALFNRLRQRYAPDACLSNAERFAVLLALLILVSMTGLQWHTQRNYQDMANERYETAKTWDVPTLPPELDIEAWELEGRVGSDGHLWSKTRLQLRLDGEAPLPQLAFTVNPELQVRRVELTGHRVVERRSWDRWILDLEPPLRPGERSALSVEVTGRPTAPHFGFYRGNSFRSFVDGFEMYRGARFARDWRDFSRTEPRPSISRRRIDLQPGDLGPIPRFTTWKLTPPSKDPGRFGQQVPEENVPVVADLKIHLVAPEGWMLADACGGISRAEDGLQVLASQCRGSLTRFVVRGGRYQLLESAAHGLTLAMLPGHQERGRSLLQGLVSVVGLSDHAWPGLPGLRSLVVLDWPPGFDIDLMKGLEFRWWKPAEEELHGALLSLPEAQVISERPLRPELLVGRVMARDLLRRRDIDPTQLHLFRHLLSGLAVRRMGLDENGAVFSSSPWGGDAMRVPLLAGTPDNLELFELRLPAVMAEAEMRAGSQHFYAAVDDFLARQGGPPGTVQELFETIESHSQVSLQKFFEEHFVNGSLPVLSLQATRQPTDDGDWEVKGSLTNKGSGQSICPISVVTEIGEQQIVVTVGEASSTPFVLRTAAAPLTAVLDPQRTCLRIQYRVSETLERVELVGTEDKPS